MSFFKNKTGFFSYRQYVYVLFLVGVLLTCFFVDSKIIPGHDYVFHISRIASVSEALKEGVFPVRIYVDEIQFWGNPVGVFYPSLFIYIPALLRLIGLPIELCYNILIIIVFYFAIYSSWYGFSILTHSKHSGFFSTLLYISSGYYLMNAYIRSSLGELIALSFMPLAIACLFLLINKTKVSVKAYVMGFLSITAIIEAHVLSSVFFVIFSFCYLALNHRKISITVFKRLSYFSISIVLLNASFIIPFGVFYYTIPTRITMPADNISMFINNTFPPFIFVLFLAFWNSWLLFSVYLFSAIQFHGYNCFSFHKSKSDIKSFLCKSYIKKYLSKYNAFLVSGLIIFISTTSLFPWNLCFPLVKAFSFMQFPWRLWGIATLLLCVCGGVFIYLLLRQLKTKNLKLITFFLTFLICVTQITAISHINPSPHWQIRAKTYWARIPEMCDLDYLYRDVNLWELLQQNNRFVTNAEVSNYYKRLTNVGFNYYAKSDSTITLPLINYPGYVAIDEDNRHLTIASNKNHMLIIPLLKGMGKITVTYEGLPIFRIADYISMFALVVFLILVIIIQKRKAWNKLL